MTDRPTDPAPSSPAADGVRQRLAIVHQMVDGGEWPDEPGDYLLQARPGRTPVFHRLHDGDIVIGRGPGCDLALAVAALSKRHCRLSRNEAGWTIADLGSTNGTRVNGQPIERHVLRHGDAIQLDRLLLFFVSVLPPE